MDAEIGHKELDWKLTISGVGRCRQVVTCYSTVSERQVGYMTNGLTSMIVCRSVVQRVELMTPCRN